MMITSFRFLGFVIIPAQISEKISSIVSKFSMQSGILLFLEVYYEALSQQKIIKSNKAEMHVP